MGIDVASGWGSHGERAKRLPAEFFYQPMRLGKESEAKGFDVYRDEPMIRIFAREGTQVFPVSEEFKRTYPEQWAAFQDKKEQPAVGTPLENWGGMTPAEVATWKGLGVRTVEELAQATDVQVTRIDGGSQRRAKAQTFVKSAKDAGHAMKLESELADLKEDYDILKAELAQIKAELAKKKG